MNKSRLVYFVVVLLFPLFACDIIEDNPYDQWEGRWKSDLLGTIFVFHKNKTWGVEVSLSSGVSAKIERMGTYSLTDTRYTMNQESNPELGIEKYTGTGNWRREGNILTLYLDRGTVSTFRKV